jgi:hypothetical protein
MMPNMKQAADVVSMMMRTIEYSLEIKLSNRRVSCFKMPSET